MDKLKELLNRKVVEIIEKGHLEKELGLGRKLRVKFGIDPTSPNLHLGHSVILRKLKEFQDLGHQIVLIIGDFTAQIGDPSGRSETRKPLTAKKVKQNMKEYLKEAGKILNIKKCEVRYNSEWFKKERLEGIIKLFAASSIQQTLRRADFKKRIDANQDITILEILYPLFQGYDSVKIKTDVELGGTDQKFNLLMGRRVQKYFSEKEQDIITCPLLEGLDGIRKMSKSYDNYIALTEKPNNMFGKIMSLPDSLINKYFELCTNLEKKEYENLTKTNPRDAKLKLAFEIVKLYHDEKKAKKAEEEFIRVFSNRETPENIQELKVDYEIGLIDLLTTAGIESKSEARRLIEQSAVKINGEVKNNPAKASLKSGDILKIGKKTFFKIK